MRPCTSLKPGLTCLRLKKPSSAGFGFGVAGLKLGQEDAGQFADAGGVAEIVLHEMLDRAAAAGVAIAHARGHLDLQVEGQLIDRRGLAM